MPRSRARRAVLPAPMLLASPPACRRAPEWPAHAPARATSWHQPSRRGDDMCRWLAYSGSPLLIADLLYKPQHSLIDQSLHSKLGAETTNGDGFGIGWYGVGEAPGVFYSVEPAWNDRNLREITEHIESSLVFAHIRASTGTPVQQTNCHPFRYGRWLWCHNGAIHEFRALRRDLMLAIDPELFPSIAGSTDSEVMFYLALTFGLRDDPVHAVERMAGFVEQVAGTHGVADALQMTVGAS